MSAELQARAAQLLDKLLDHDLPYSAQTGAAQIVDDLLAALRVATPAQPTEAPELVHLRERWNRVVKAAEHAHGPDAIRFKLSLRKNGTTTNIFPRWLDQRWVSFVFAEDDAHIGYIAKAIQATAQPTEVEEGCTPTDAKVLRQANHVLSEENQRMRETLRFYAAREHFNMADPDAWDTVSGEPQNFWCDEAGTATVEDGTLAAMTLRGEAVDWEGDPPPVCAGEPEDIIARAALSTEGGGNG